MFKTIIFWWGVANIFKVEKICNGPFEENSYLIWSSASKSAVLIDPGSEPNKISSIIDDLQVSLLAILNTHAHIDHVGAVSFISQKYNSPFYLHELELEILNSIPQYSQLFGLPEVKIPQVDYYFEEKSYEFKELKIEIIYTPGHTKGGVCFLIENHLFTGDTLFFKSIGRTDLPTGDFTSLISSIKNQLFGLPNETIVYPGHGENTSIGFERENNPFLN